ncbi:UNVERIFIED_CONTAM: hypothetical protein Sradi_6874400 [Sesamum radiatum]|uniref:Uncharacterized protein n=1 Tax=Sesamum radiatum TaxID=300843 RepID=A0AAW2JK62_SESRA
MASHFQHHPVRAAKKTFQDDDIQIVGSSSSYKGEPNITPMMKRLKTGHQTEIRTCGKVLTWSSQSQVPPAMNH